MNMMNMPVLDTQERERIFAAALRKVGLSQRYPGVASIDMLKQALLEMKLELERSSTTPEDSKGFKDAITRSIDEEPNLPCDQRDALRGVLGSVFDGMLHETSVIVVKCNFLTLVRF